MHINAIPTPAAVVDASALSRNLQSMAARLPGSSLRPHVKAHKCTKLAAQQVAHGHRSFTCATPREVIGMITAGVGDDLLLANSVLDVDRLTEVATAAESAGVIARVAVDSVETIKAAHRAGVGDVIIDVDVGMPRCGARPDHAGQLADVARQRGLSVSGVMGYEGHLQMVSDRSEAKERVAEAMSLLRAAHDDVGGDIVSTGGTGTHDLHTIGLDHPTGVTDVQAGSYVMVDTQYATLDQGFEQALTIVGTVIAHHGSRYVIDVGLKALGMDHGDPSIDDCKIWFCSDEHTTFTSSERTFHIGERVHVRPAHVDPTIARHEELWIVDNGEVIDRWPIDLRHW